MKPTPRSKVAMPKASLAYGVYINGNLESLQMNPRPGDEWPLTLVSVRPHRSKSAAQAKVRFDNLGWEEKIQRVAKASDDYFDSIAHNHEAFKAHDHAIAVLLAIGERPERGGKL